MKNYENLAKWNRYKTFIDGISDNIKTKISDYLKQTTEKATYENPTLEDKIDNMAYRKILIENVKDYLEKIKKDSLYGGIIINDIAKLNKNYIKKNVNSTTNGVTMTQVNGWNVFDKKVLKLLFEYSKEELSPKLKRWEWAKDHMLHFEGFVDDNAWGENDKGDIIFSSKQGKSYRISDDGNITGIGNNEIENLIDKLIANKDLT